MGAIPKVPRNLPENEAPARKGLGGYDAGFDQINDEYGMDIGSNLYGLHQNHHGFTAISPSAAIAMDIGTDSHKLQLMKASFFIDDEFDGKSGKSTACP